MKTLTILIALSSLFVSIPEQADANTPLFVISGGRTSCRSGITNIHPGWDSVFSAYKIVEANRYVNSQQKPRYIFTCYGLNNSTIQVSTSQDPGRSYSMHESQLTNLVFQMAGSSEVVIVGHSMGGWLAMHLVLNIQGRLPIRKLTTIDPISPVLCRRPRNRACRRAPGDFSDAQLSWISQRVGSWSNFYQTTTRIMKSSSIDFAHSNIRLNARHSKIDTHQRVWSDLLQAL